MKDKDVVLSLSRFLARQVKANVEQFAAVEFQSVVAALLDNVNVKVRDESVLLALG